LPKSEAGPKGAGENKADYLHCGDIITLLWQVRGGLARPAVVYDRRKFWFRKSMVRCQARSAAALL
jgi:hypothetical protein